MRLSVPAPLAPAQRASPARRAAGALRRSPAFSVGLALVSMFALVALIGPALMPYAPTQTDSRATFDPPSAEHWLGTDKFGRDVLTRVVYATRLDLAIAAAVALSAFTLGSLIGGLAGYYGGWLDDVIMRVVDVLFAFPAFILAMAITGILGDTVENVVIAIATAYVPYFIRLTRAEMLTVRTLQYADAALSVGNPRWRVMLVHLLPNALTPSLVQAALVFGWAILDAAGLAFLGLGITPPTAEWGVLVSEGAQRLITGEWWVWLFPGAAIVLAAFAFSLLGDGLRDLNAREAGR
jgi:peptide/nickel transport system permease protein